ncbi:hypothetical protein LGT39_01550 [Demequina sp. TTPB684]|uniref:hypothetical protein n=1 Tax=unclassified Demequina TaxID=2620311 RepID=UPI001CF1E95C|nr:MULTISPECIES: hypothetical protein [unclassified Demequina]MCB2411533.1 hypothetical protein [Demequina sp. TTPB684]UPU88087.1 hypothetical protein LGT36_012685 [Demequina sp. TMPB413]
MSDTESAGEANEVDYLPNLKIAYSELDRLTLYYERRFDAVQSKAALLVTGAAVLAGLTIGRAPLTSMGVLLPALAAAVLGTLTLWPRVKPNMSAPAVRAALLPPNGPLPSEREALLSVYDTRAALLEEREESLKRIAPLLRSGFVLLSVSLVPIIIEAIVLIAVD